MWRNSMRKPATAMRVPEILPVAIWRSCALGGGVSSILEGEEQQRDARLSHDMAYLILDPAIVPTRTRSAVSRRR